MTAPTSSVLLIPEHTLVRVRALHASIDNSAERLAALHRERLQCRRGCSDCCIDELEVSIVEAARIAVENPGLLETGDPAPPGRCAMLGGEGECRVYTSRPYVCRTQGLPLRWVDHEAQIERRDECPKNEPPPSSTLPRLEDIPAEACWTLGAAEQAIAALAIVSGAAPGRTALRSLFATRAGKSGVGAPTSRKEIEPSK